MLWALPCSAVGVLLGMIVFCMGGSFRCVGHTIEVALSPAQDQVPHWAARLRFAGITFGQVIVGQSHQVLAELRLHERVHVRQYERLGLLFFVAYPISSLAAWLQGKSPYLANRFEQEAIKLGDTGQEKTQPESVGFLFLVEAAGIEPASASPLPWDLHAYSAFCLTGSYPTDRDNRQPVQ